MKQEVFSTDRLTRIRLTPVLNQPLLQPFVGTSTNKRPSRTVIPLGSWETWWHRGCVALRRHRTRIIWGSLCQPPLVAYTWQALQQQAVPSTPVQNGSERKGRLKGRPYVPALEAGPVCNQRAGQESMLGIEAWLWSTGLYRMKRTLLPESAARKLG